MTTTINKIISICQSASIFKDTLADLALQELLVKIVQSQTLKGVVEGNSPTTSPMLLKITQLILENISNKIELKSISKQVGMSTSSSYLLFKTKLGISPVEFILLKKSSWRNIFFQTKIFISKMYLLKLVLRTVIILFDCLSIMKALLPNSTSNYFTNKRLLTLPKTARVPSQLIPRL